MKSSVELFCILENAKEGGYNITLRPRPLLLAEEERVQGHVGNLGDLEPDAGNITDGVALPTESGDENFVILLDKVEAAVLGHECRDLLAVLDQLDTDALSDGRVRLLGLDADLSEKYPTLIKRVEFIMTFVSTLTISELFGIVTFPSVLQFSRVEIRM